MANNGRTKKSPAPWPPRSLATELFLLVVLVSKLAGLLHQATN
jgi:hypothetical protein